MYLDSDDECNAAPGLGGWLSCTVNNCSCNQCEETILESSDTCYDYTEYYWPEPKQVPLKLDKLGFTYSGVSTEKAMLFKHSQKNCTLWLPKSVVSDKNLLKASFIATAKVVKTKQTTVVESLSDADTLKYKGKTRGSIRKALLTDEISDVGFSPTKIYITKVIVITKTLTLLEFINKYEKGRS